MFQTVVVQKPRYNSWLNHHEEGQCMHQYQL